jgi:hypothetical protein
LHSVGEAEREAMNKLEGIDFFGTNTRPDKNAPVNMHLAYWQRKMERPSYEMLKKDVEQMGYVGSGKKYGVSDNGVKK